MRLNNVDVLVPLNAEDLFKNLYYEVKDAVPCAQLSFWLRNQLERCNESVRTELASRKMEGCSPFFTACRKGNVEIVEYLISICKANVEDKGEYKVQDDQTVHTVTPLWCAAVAGNIQGRRGCSFAFFMLNSTFSA